LEWMQTLRKAINYMEKHLLHDCTVEEIAANVNISPFYFQKGFKIMTGYSIGEYLRNRRLYLAALEVIRNEEKIIDLAYKYGYDTPESFTKAFSRFHGVSPMQIKAQPYEIKTFLPLQISISIKGGNIMDFRIEKLDAFSIIGLERLFQYDGAFQEIPQFWQEFCGKYLKNWDGELEKCCIGRYGVSIDEEMNGKNFRYLIAGKYHSEIIPEGFKVVKIPALTFAKFRCVGPMPEALQAVNTRIFHEWLPGNEAYEIAAGYNIEMYSKGDINARDYLSEIWIPVKKKATPEIKLTNQSKK
jgi:AraC family transcriptional regulator